jgi:hypothetical protein
MVLKKVQISSFDTTEIHHLKLSPATLTNHTKIINSDAKSPYLVNGMLQELNQVQLPCWLWKSSAHFFNTFQKHSNAF